MDAGDGVLIERYYHHLFTSDEEIHALCREIGIPDELATWKSDMAMFVARQAVAVHQPARPPALQAAVAPRRASGMGVAAVLLQRKPDDVAPLRGPDDQAVGRQEHGQAGRGTRSGTRCCAASSATSADDISMSWLFAKLRNRRQTSGEEAKQELLVYPRGSFEAIFQRLQQKIEENGAGADRPARRPGQPDRRRRRSSCTRGAPTRSARATTRASFESGGEPERYDAVLATAAHRHLRAGARPGAAGRGRRRTTSTRPTRSSTSRRSAWCSSSTASSTTTTGPTWPTRT